MDYLYYFQINSFSSFVFRVVFFFYIPIYRGYYALPFMILEETYKRKQNFKMAKSITRRNISNGK